MAYIPSWSENPNTQRGLQSFFQSIAQGIAPDFYAQQTFNQMAQQDPNLVNVIADMDDGQRETFSKALGAKNKNPLAKIGVGAKRAERERIAAIRGGLTDQQKAIADAREVGTVVQADIDRQAKEREQADVIASQQVTRNEQAIAKDRFSLKRLDEAEALQKQSWDQYPELSDVNLERLADQVIKGSANPLALKRIEGSPAELVLKEAVETRRKRMAHDEDIDMLGRRTAAERSLMKERTAGTTPDALLDRARIFGSAVAEKNNKVMDADREIVTMLQQDNMFAMYLKSSPEQQKKMAKSINPAAIERYQQLQAAKMDAKEEAKFYADAQKKVLEKLPEMMKQSQEAAAMNETPQAKAAIQRIDSGQATLDQALASPSLTEETKAYLRAKYSSKKAPTIKVKG
jgi:hypothetical protein